MPQEPNRCGVSHMDLPRSRKSMHGLFIGGMDAAFPDISTMEDKKPRLQIACLLLFATLGIIFASSLVASQMWFGRTVYNSMATTSRPIVNHHLDEQISLSAAIQEISEASTPQREKGTSKVLADRTLKGLQADSKEFGPNDRCRSRGHPEHKESPVKPSEELLKRLRNYEALHRKCAGRARVFNYDPTLKTNTQEMGSEGDDCRYVVWIAFSGLGNRLMTVLSAFVYALLTNRVLLIDGSADMSELFCEPFPQTSWLVPPEFSLEWLQSLNETSPQRFAHNQNSNYSGEAGKRAMFSYVHLTHTADKNDELFFCDSGQEELDSIPWIFFRCDTYVVPGLFFISKFEADLRTLFPEKEAIFHLLGRYLFHPSDIVWGRITRYHKAYLAGYKKQVGIQIRTFRDEPLPYVSQQVQRCFLDNRILPNVTADQSGMKDQESGSDGYGREVTSVLVTSLHPVYYENIREYYLSSSSQDGEFVAVHQPSYELWQQTDRLDHDMKAWVDIYLLSLSDVLITSGWSTFGYAAQALAGTKSWILVRSTNCTAPDPPCVLAKSFEPCFHVPPQLQCRRGYSVNPARILPYIQSCEDVDWGVKVID